MGFLRVSDPIFTLVSTDFSFDSGKGTIMRGMSQYNFKIVESRWRISCVSYNPWNESGYKGKTCSCKPHHHCKTPVHIGLNNFKPGIHVRAQFFEALINLLKAPLGYMYHVFKNFSLVFQLLFDTDNSLSDFNLDITFDGSDSSEVINYISPENLINTKLESLRNQIDLLEELKNKIKRII